MKFKSIAILVLSATVVAGAITYLVNKKEYKSFFGNELYIEAIEAKSAQEKDRKLKKEGKTLDDFTQPEEEISFLEQKLNSENLLTHDNAVQLDIDNDGIKENISLRYEADSEYLEIIKVQNKYICYTNWCSEGIFELFKKEKEYIFRIKETLYSVPGENCTYDWPGLVEEENEWRLFKYRNKDEFVWKQNKLIPQHKWTIQINSFTRRKKAIAYVDKLLNEGYDVYIKSKINEERIGDLNNDEELDHNVLLGSYKQRTEAEEVLKEFIKKHPETKPLIKLKEDTVICKKL